MKYCQLLFSLLQSLLLWYSLQVLLHKHYLMVFLLSLSDSIIIIIIIIIINFDLYFLSSFN